MGRKARSDKIFRRVLEESVGNPVWLDHARAALDAATTGSASVGAEVAQLIQDEAVCDAGLVQAALFWIDTLIDATKSTLRTDPIQVPDIWPADMPPSQRWALRMVGARINDDPDAADELMAEAARNFDHLTECLLMLVILAGMGFGGRLSPGSPD